MSTLAPGTTVGAYEIVRHIATGGMGSVYEARNRITGEARALKVMRADLASQSDFVQRFIREIRLTMSLEHPNLVRVFEPGMHGELVFLPMELLQGETLSKYLKERGALPENEALAITSAVGSALAALHDKGIVHRDVKPSNVFLTRGLGGQIVPKVLDLGAARTAEVTEELTATGLAIGSPQYMAPEQASGAKNVDHRADQYSLGVMAYQMLTAARPYENDDTGHALAKLLANVAYPSPRAINPAISPLVERVILRAMSRPAAERFASVRDMLAAFEAAVSGRADASLVTRIAPLPAPQPARFTPPTVETTTGPVAVQTAPRSGAGWIVGAAAALVVVGSGVIVAARVLGTSTAAPAEATPLPEHAGVPATSAEPSAAATAPPTVSAPPPLATPALPLTGAPVLTASAPPTASTGAAPTAAASTLRATPHATSRATATVAPCVATPGAPCL